MQKISKPEEVCDDPEDVPAPKSCSEHVSHWPARPGQEPFPGWGPRAHSAAYLPREPPAPWAA